jgi:DNA-binding response OmpR family regulator
MSPIKHPPAKPARGNDAREISELLAVRVRPKAVLIVEPDPEVQSRLASALSREGHRVVGTGSGEGALALVEEWAVDVALVGDSLPGRSGLEVGRLIRERRPETTVLIMTEQVGPSTRLAVRAVGGHDCLRKPVELDALRPFLLDTVSQPQVGRRADVAQ